LLAPKNSHKSRFPLLPNPTKPSVNEEEEVKGKAPLGCASFTLIFICLDAAESPPPLEREERASQPHLGLQAVGGSHLHLLQRACWLVLNGNTCQMLLQFFCRIERERGETEIDNGEDGFNVSPDHKR
jgi:hypothetical protein